MNFQNRTLFIADNLDIMRGMDDETVEAHVHKRALFGEQEGKRNGCLLMFPFRNMTIDHIVAQSLGGTDHIENLQLLCNACNSTKSTWSQEEFIDILIEQGIRS